MGLGIRNTDPAANYSGSGLGKYTTIADRIIANSGVTSASGKVAINALYDGLKSKGLWNKLDHIKVMGLGQVFDSLNWKDPSLTSSTRTTFINDTGAAHTKDGFVPDTTTARYGELNFKFKTSVPALHVHVFNSTAENTSGDNILSGYSQGTGKSAFFISRRFAGTKTTVALSNGGAPQQLQAATGYDNSKTGLLSMGYQNGNLIMWDGGAKVTQAAYTGGTPIAVDLAGPSIALGGYRSNPSTVTYFSACAIQFWAAGVSDWSDADESNLNALVNSFRTAIQ
jgi:hypothetical protein